MAFLNLYKKELRESGFAALILVLLTLGFHFFSLHQNYSSELSVYNRFGAGSIFYLSIVFSGYWL